MSDLTVAADLKLANIMCGISSHASTYPCIYCTWSKGEKDSIMPRSFHGIKQMSEDWKNAGQVPVKKVKKVLQLPESTNH